MPGSSLVLFVGLVGLLAQFGDATIPSCESCLCWVILDDDSLDSGRDKTVDFDWWADNVMDTFFASEGICSGKGQECLMNHGASSSSYCKDISAGGSGSISKPDGSSCTAPPYNTNYYNPLWLWNRATKQPGLCGTGVTARVPTGRGVSGAPDTGIWRIGPTVSSFDGVEIVGHTSSCSCNLPSVVPAGYAVHQIVSGTRQLVSKSGGDSVKWHEVLYEQWVRAYMMGLIRESCLECTIRKMNPVSNVEVADMVGRTCLAMVYDSDVGYGYLLLLIQVMEIRGSSQLLI